MSKLPSAIKLPVRDMTCTAAKLPVLILLPASIWTFPVTLIVLAAAALPIVNTELFVTRRLPPTEVVFTAAPPRMKGVPETSKFVVMLIAAEGVIVAELPDTRYLPVIFITWLEVIVRLLPETERSFPTVIVPVFIVFVPDPANSRS